MGQDLSMTSDSPKLIKSLKIIRKNTVYILKDMPKATKISKLMENLNKAFKNLQHPVVSLKTKENNEILDYWLSMPEKNLFPLCNDQELLPVYFASVPLKVGIKSFEIIKVIGEGAYSIVTQVRKKDTGMIYALKSIKKQVIIKERLQQHLLAEKEILSTIDCPFVAKLNWAFQTKNKLHFVMDFYPGGELYYHLRNIHIFTEDQCRFYFAEILLGLEALHSRKIAYRDLKPENIVIDIDGHIRLTDFGLSKIDMYENSMSFCGSPEYMSPEMLQGKGHGNSVDYYCLGALLYEMLTGLPPYYDREPSKMFRKILEEELHIPENLTPSCKNILAGLLTKNPENRLGSNSVEDIKSHYWCKNINWDQYKAKMIKPPLVPSLRKSHFDRFITEKKVPLFSDEEAQDLDFASFDFNLLPTNDKISRYYFESSHKNKRSESQKPSKKSVPDISQLKGESLIENGFSIGNLASTQVSPAFSPLSSPNSSCVANEAFTFHDFSAKFPRKLNKRLLVHSPQNISCQSERPSIIEPAHDTSNNFGDYFRKSISEILAKIKK